MKAAEPEMKAPVTVVMPEVKLTIEDLSYMTGLMPGATRCRSAGKTTDRLVFLGLIEMATVPPCKIAMADYERTVIESKAAIRLAIKEGRWEDIGDHARVFSKYGGAKPKETKDYVLTVSGREFMAKGRAQTITSKKAGCVK